MKIVNRLMVNVFVLGLDVTIIAFMIMIIIYGHPGFSCFAAIIFGTISAILVIFNIKYNLQKLNTKLEEVK